MKQTLDQRRANHAWNAVQQAKALNDSCAKEYGRHVKKLPMRIRSAGLGQALAFVLSKAGSSNSKKYKAHLCQIHKNLTSWVIEQRGLKGKKEDSLILSIIEGDSDFLRRATDETMAYLQWLNRFADAEGLTDDEEPS